MLFTDAELQALVETGVQDLPAFQARLPQPPAPIGSYVGVVRVGNLLYTSGVLPMQDGQVAYQGALGAWGISVGHGQRAARLCVLNALGLLQHALDGELRRVRRVVKVTGFVSSAKDFYDQPAVMNGASDLLAAVFGEAGRHARSAVGVSALPRDASVELELVVEVADDVALGSA